MRGDVVPPLQDVLGGGVFSPHTFRYPYRSHVNPPAFAFASPSRSADDVAICERLIEAWRRAAADEPDNGLVDREGMWAHHQKGHRRFWAALQQGDAETLAEILASMFDTHIVHGIAMGRAAAFVARRATGPFVLNWCDSDVGAIEREAGIPLVFPDVGAPYGVRVNDSIFPELSFSHYLAAYLMPQVDGPVFEIGGGFGGLAWFANREDYTIFDLPFTNIIQGYFLLRTGVSTSLYGEPRKKIRVLPWWEIEKRESYALAVNQDSIPEMPHRIGAYYIDRIAERASLFFSINQEQAANNASAEIQLRVPELIAKRAGGGIEGCPGSCSGSEMVMWRNFTPLILSE